MPLCKGKTKKRTEKQVADEWEARLKRMGLTMEAGRSEFLNYGLGSDGRDFDGREFVPEDKV